MLARMNQMEPSMILGTDTITGKPVTLSAQQALESVYFPGSTGSGKTTLYKDLILQNMEAGYGVCVLDPHDLVDELLAIVPGHRERDVVLLDATDTDFPFPLNLYHCQDPEDQAAVARIVDQSVEVFKRAWEDTSWGPRLEDLLGNIGTTLSENECSMTEIPLLLTDERFRENLAANVNNPVVAQFWRTEYPLAAREQRDMYVSTMNKVRSFLRNPILYNIVGQTTCVDFLTFMNDGNLVFIKLPVGKLGGPSVSVLGAALVARILNSALSRSPEKRRQFNLYCDEFHRFATSAFATLFAEARKYGVATFVAHQYLGQLDFENQKAVLAIPHKVIFSVSGEDAKRFSEGADCTPPDPPVIGLRPQQTICQDPLNHLLHRGHHQDRVRRIVAQYLTPLVNFVNQHPPSQNRHDAHWRVSLNPSGYSTYDTTARHSVDAINRYLVDVMEKRFDPWSQANFKELFSIVIELRDVFGFAPGADIDGWETPLPELTKRAMLHWLDFLYNDPDCKYPLQAREVESTLVVARFHDLLTTSPQRASSKNLHQMWRYLLSRAAAEAASFGSFFLDMLALAQDLFENPILVDSGQYEPIYDHPRTYADVAAQRANEMVTLPKHYARFITRQSGSKHYTIHCKEWEPVIITDEMVQKIERIRQRSRELYCRPREQVLQEIKDRHARFIWRMSQPLQTTRRVQLSGVASNGSAKSS